MNKLSKVVGLLLGIISMSAYADNTLGSVAANITLPISAARYAFNGAAYIIGSGFLIASFFRYLRYRHNPQEAPISSVLLLAIIGVVLILLPLSYNLTNYLSQQQGMSDVIP